MKEIIAPKTPNCIIPLLYMVVVAPTNTIEMEQIKYAPDFDINIDSNRTIFDKKDIIALRTC
jgi:hypothetical protein